MSWHYAPSREIAHAGDSRWIVTASVLVFCQYAIAIFVGNRIGFSARFPTDKYMVIALVISLLGGSMIAAPEILRLWRQREQHPIARLVREADRSAVVTYLVGFQLIALEFGALTWLKNMLPAVIPYWADPALASADRAILGTDAWRLVPVALTRGFDVIYVSWAPVHTITVISMLCLRPSRIKARAMLAWFLTVGLMGVCGQYFLSSAGPIFYDRIFGGDVFAPLMARIGDHAEFTGLAQEFLWTSYSLHGNQIGNGISAMPSIHVATTAWIVLSLSSVWPRLRLALWAYWLAIFVGSFALGWHYLLDGVIGTAGALGCWFIATRILSNSIVEPEPGTLATIG